MEHIANRYMDQNIVVLNYRSTIKRLARETASLSSVPSYMTPQSPDMAISPIVSTETSTVYYSIGAEQSFAEIQAGDEHSGFVTAPSLRSSSVYISASASISTNTQSVTVESNGILQRVRDSKYHGIASNEASLLKQDEISRTGRLPSHELPHVGILQIFVKGLSPSTQVFLLYASSSYFDLLQELQNRLGVPPDRISLYYHGRRLTDTINLPNNVTLMGSINAFAVQRHDHTYGERSYELEDFDKPRGGKLRKRSLMIGNGGVPSDLRDMRLYYAQSRKSASSVSSMDTRSSGWYHGDEITTQKRYAWYLKSLFQKKS
jgi:hypothetical protein